MVRDADTLKAPDIPTQPAHRVHVTDLQSTPAAVPAHMRQCGGRAHASVGSRKSGDSMSWCCSLAFRQRGWRHPGDTQRPSNIPAKGCVCACRSPSCRTTGSGCSSSTTSATTVSTTGRRVRPRPDTEVRLYRKHSRTTGLALHSSHQRKHHAAQNRVSSLTAPPLLQNNR